MAWNWSGRSLRKLPAALLDFVLFERTCCKTFTYELRVCPAA